MLKQLNTSKRRCLYTKPTSMLQLPNVWSLRKTYVVDMLYAATAVNLNIVDHLACATNQPNVSTVQVITLQTPNNAHNGRNRRKKIKLKRENNISFPDARNQYKQLYTGQTYVSAVKPSTCYKSTQTDDKSTQTDDNIAE